MPGPPVSGGLRAGSGARARLPGPQGSGILTSMVSARATLIGGLAIAGVGSIAGAFAESGALPERMGADGHGVAREESAGLFVTVAARRDGIEQCKVRLVAGKRNEFFGVWNGFEIIGLRPAGYQNKVGAFGSRKGGLFSPGWRVD